MSTCNHQGLGNELINSEDVTVAGDEIAGRAPLGSLLKYYYRAA